MTPIAKIKFKMAGYPMTNPRMNKRIPMINENIVNRMINLFIYFCKGVSYWRSFALAAKLAICPMNVLSPVPKTTPTPVPYLTKVEKKAMFFV